MGLKFGNQTPKTQDAGASGQISWSEKDLGSLRRQIGQDTGTPLIFFPGFSPSRSSDAVRAGVGRPIQAGEGAVGGLWGGRLEP